jgi:steroid delta-isomerase-like uncharacterized protein
MSAAENKALIRRALDDLLNGRNLTLVTDYYAQDYVWHGGDGNDVSGPEGYKQLLSMYFDAFPDLQIAVDDQIAEDDRVATRWTVRATHQGAFGSIAPTGRSVAVSGTLISRIREGKVIEDWEYFDNLHLLQQLGVAPTG